VQTSVLLPSKILSYCIVFGFISQCNGVYKRHCKYNLKKVIDKIYSKYLTVLMTAKLIQAVIIRNYSTSYKSLIISTYKVTKIH